MKKYFSPWWIILIGFFPGYILFLVFKPAPMPNLRKVETNLSFHEFYQKKINQSQEKRARRDNQEKLVRYSEDLSDAAILYIHGFGACRAEGEMVTDSIGSKLQANTYYLRLPGHGTNKDEHASVSFSDYIAEAEEALLMMPKLGKKTIIIGTSMGGLLATWLAAQYPEKVDALILVSPFYDYAHIAGKLVNVPGMVNLIAYLDKKGRLTLPEKQINAGYVLPEYADFWYTEQKYEALLSLEDLKDFAANAEVYEKVTSPVLMFYYYKNEEEQDKAACVSSMLSAYDQFGKAVKPHPMNKKVNISNGDHVMFSKYIQNNKDTIYEEVFAFLNRVLNQPG